MRYSPSSALPGKTTWMRPISIRPGNSRRGLRGLRQAAIAVAAARNFRFLRRRGITGTWCIENRTALLHNDSDFHAMSRYVGLKEFRD
jgi:hypothetical protein